MIYEPPHKHSNFNAMTIQSTTDRDIIVEISNCFNHKHVKSDSAYKLLDKYLRHECGLTYHEVDDVIDRMEELMAEHIIEIIESKNS